MQLPKGILAGLIGVFLFLWASGAVGYAQVFESAEVQIQRDRLHLRAADWEPRAKAQSAIQVGEAVRLRDGASTGRITSAPIELPFAVNGVGPHWDATVPKATRVDVEVRTRAEGTDWSEWVAPTHRTRVPATSEATSMANTYAGDVVGGLVLTEPDTRYVQVRLTLRAAPKASPVLRRLSLYVVNAMAGPAAPADVSQKKFLRGGVPDTLKPNLSRREEWGARAPEADYRHHPASHLAIHHTATATVGAADTWDDCAAGVRAIQDYHMDTHGWIDIGYNYLVCQTGHLFQGREDGNDRRDVVGAHDGYNDGSVGTAALGYFHPPENQHPSPTLIDGFVDLFGWIGARREIAPNSTRRYPDYGPLRTVYGHRSVTATACPGDHLYAKREDIVDRLADLLPDTPDETTVGPNRPNPAATETHFDLRLAEGAGVTLTVYDLLGRRIARRRYGYYGPGTHTVTLRTDQFSSGTYPYRLVVEEESRTGLIRIVR